MIHSAVKQMGVLETVAGTVSRLCQHLKLHLVPLFLVIHGSQGWLGLESHWGSTEVDLVEVIVVVVIVALIKST